MHLHEYQAKQLLADYGVPTPKGQAVSSVLEAQEAAKLIGGRSWVVKAQVHAGGRGKAGGVKGVQGLVELEKAVDELLGSRLATTQTGPEGLPVNVVLIEEAVALAQEFYLACLVDRTVSRVAFVASAAGGMDIEAVAKRDPTAVHQVAVDPVVGLQPYQCRQLAFAMGMDAAQARALTGLMAAVYRLFTERDLSLVEINPLGLTADGCFLAVDAKIDVDDSALYRHKELAALRDPSQENETEYRAQQHGLNYVALGGSIGCMVNGAGLAMATMDLIKLHGGEPANFLDVGGGTTAEKVAEAFKLLIADGRVKAILINIFGGIVRCDLIAQGIVDALREVQVEVPVVVRLQGTNAEAGRLILERSGLRITAASELGEAARLAVRAAGR